MLISKYIFFCYLFIALIFGYIIGVSKEEYVINNELIKYSKSNDVFRLENTQMYQIFSVACNPEKINTSKVNIVNVKDLLNHSDIINKNCGR